MTSDINNQTENSYGFDPNQGLPWHKPTDLEDPLLGTKPSFLMLGSSSDELPSIQIISPVSIITNVIDLAKNPLTQVAHSNNLEDILTAAFGNNYDRAKAGAIVKEFGAGDFSELPKIDIVTGLPLNTNGAYDSLNNRIYLSEQFVNNHNQDEIVGVVLEEIGHSIDVKINKQDAAGDEGYLFSGLVRGESISGEELLRLKAEDDHAVIWLNGQQIAIEQNNSLNTANNIGTLNGSKIFRDWVGSTDTNDYYRFYIGNTSNFSLSLTGLSADADVKLLNSSGGEIGSSTNSGSLSESITQFLSAGTYYVRVYPYSSANTNYTLSLNATAIPDNAGNTLSSARNLGILNSARNFSDWVGSLDTDDYYRFNVSSASNFSLSLTGLSADADVKLLNGFGDEIGSSTKDGSLSESITQFLSAGTYYVRVYPYSSANTNYTLSLNATAIPDNAGNTLSSARNLGTLSANNQGRYNFTANDFIGSIDPNDYYRFTLNNRSTFNLTLNNLSADADLQLIWDKNGNGSVDSSDETWSSTFDGTSRDSISRILDAGTYLVRTYQGVSTANTNYSLNFLADLNWGTISGVNGFGQTLTHQVGIERVDGSSTAISSSRTTWLVIHGMDGNPIDQGAANDPNTIRLLGRAIDGYTSGDQVFYLNWSSAARSNVVAPIGASWITTAASWAAQRLNEWGISTGNINLVGHSLGAYVAAETASRVSGGVNRLVALDPAANHLLGTYNASSVNFSANSWRSWGFYGSSLGDSGRTVTADESFTMGFGDNAFWSNHGRVVNLFASMVQQSYTNANNQISQMFGLNRLFNDSRGSWRLNEFNDIGSRGVGIGNYEGRLEGREELQWDSQDNRWVTRWVAKEFRYKQDSDPWWNLGLTQITA
jgi:pimeloyl-ACP methyl ester carboxylesterase